ncbi:hypothetical protein ADK86_29295 [Streptomyces sp. NRRL F-5755]|nr:hypothetical protein ADK86_29295 [Streptomyces sp. NRRL F-5755]
MSYRAKPSYNSLAIALAASTSCAAPTTKAGTSRMPSISLSNSGATAVAAAAVPKTDLPSRNRWAAAASSSRSVPADAGLPDDGSRRVPGLRRDEVAFLAGVSTDYYVRLEQGRERHPSEQVLRARRARR